MPERIVRIKQSVNMDTTLKECLFIVVTMAMRTEAGGSITQDVCTWKTYKAICTRNEVIQVEQAHFGQMSVGSCIKQDVHSFTRCQVDVLSYLDSICSGRQACQITLPDQNLVTENQPCLQSLQAYLQLQYKCVSVYTSPTPCTNNLLLVSGASGLLANFITEQTRQGSTSCPWQIQGSPGQKIRLTLHDYGVWKPKTSEGDGSESQGARMPLPKRTGICQIYARITEGASERTITICGDEMRESVVYVSAAEFVQITLTDPKHSQSPSYFLLQYGIIGCPTYIPPEGAVIEQQRDEILVKCPRIGNEWRVSCDGMRWISVGEVKDCNVSVVPSMSFGNLVDGAQDLPQWILIVVIIVAAAIIAIPILVIGIVSFRRKHELAIAYMPNQQMDVAKGTYLPQYNAKELDPMLSEGRSQKYPQGREYTSTAHRNMVVRPDDPTQGGRFPTLPLPPTSLISDAGNRTIHGTLSHKRSQPEDNRTMFKLPGTEHKYESPTFLRRTRSESDTSDPLCHTVDPEGVDLPMGNKPQLGHIDSDTETE